MMRGTAYAIGEIVVFLALAGLIGAAIGWVAAKASNPGAARPAVPAADTEARRLRAELAEVQKRQREMQDAAARTAELERELAVAQWQINTLEDELTTRSEAG
jgi:hypothetical protein